MSLGEEQLAEENAAPSSEHSNGVVGCSAIFRTENVNLIELKAVKMGGVLPRMLVPLPPLGTVAELIAVSGFIVSLNMAASHVEPATVVTVAGGGFLFTNLSPSAGLKSLTMSSALPQSNVSAPGPPVSSSLAFPPSRKSSPFSPNNLSCPFPPSRVSFPSQPCHSSFPLPPLIVSVPEPP